MGYSAQTRIPKWNFSRFGGSPGEDPGILGARKIANSKNVKLEKSLSVERLVPLSLLGF